MHEVPSIYVRMAEKHCIVPEASKCRKSQQKHMVNGWLPGQGVQARFHKSSKKLKECENRRTWTFRGSLPHSVCRKEICYLQRSSQQPETHSPSLRCPTGQLNNN